MEMQLDSGAFGYRRPDLCSHKIISTSHTNKIKNLKKSERRLYSHPAYQAPTEDRGIILAATLMW